jgi:hypothetical protein
MLSSCKNAYCFVFDDWLNEKWNHYCHTALTGILSALSSQSDFTWQYVTSSIIKGRKESSNMKD